MRTEELAADIPDSMTAACDLFSKMGFGQKEGEPGRWTKTAGSSNAASG